MRENKGTHSNDLKRYRTESGYTQKEVCRLIGLASENRLSEWENGTSVPNVTNLFKLAYLYKVEPQKLYVENYEELRITIKQKKRELYPPILRERSKKKEVDISLQFKSKNEAIDYLAKILLENFFYLKRNGKL